MAAQAEVDLYVQPNPPPENVSVEIGVVRGPVGSSSSAKAAPRKLGIVVSFASSAPSKKADKEMGCLDTPGRGKVLQCFTRSRQAFLNNSLRLNYQKYNGNKHSILIQQHAGCLKKHQFD
ncbi:hypothetical protein Taro_012546 [Colocasia esculenta]|uniref:Uncharacterized protein n=1 Tax=Colocasia esculenta TaxID=4460 RepID=A0A843UDC7_COLES|nr:hypothetical protein [Colocasia esculenta]